MRLYDPQNIGQWVMQYLGKDNILSPFAGGLRSDSSKELQAAPSPTTTTTPSGSRISDLFSSLVGSSGGSSGSAGSAPPGGNTIQWFDPYGRPSPPPRGTSIPGTMISSL
jgi:hypothetical protein